jgi:hypothetical protein
MTPDVTSDIALDGSLSHLTVAEDSRSQKSMIIGGANDGSVAVWDS